MFMDGERKKRKQTIKLIITEIIMVLAVITTVVILTFVAMGYNVNKDGDLAQSGLLQLKSFPTGATVEIDEETMLAHTNMSRMLSSGSHTVKLTKDGYESWQKEIVSEPGWLLKLEYPRLFLQDRTMEKMREYADELQNLSYASDGSQILYKLKSEEKWTLLNISGDDISETSLDLAKHLDKNEVVEISWNKNNDKVLLRTKNSEKTEWVLINLRDVSKSLNLSTEFDLNFTRVAFLTATGERLLVSENGNLRTITVGDKTVSQVLARSVEDFYSNEPTIVYSGNYNGKKELLLYLEGTEDVKLAEFRPDTNLKFTTSEYLGKKYLTIAADDKIYVYRGDYPDDSNIGLTQMELVKEAELGFAPEFLKVWSDQQLIMAKSGTSIASFDAELSQLSSFSIEDSNIFFLDDYLIGNLSDGKIVVRDFDGENRHELSRSDSAAIISRNNKWIYYSLSVNGKTNIFREKIVE